MTNDIVKAIISVIILTACIYALCCALLPACKEEDNYDEFDK